MTMSLKVFDTLGTITVVTPPSMINPGAISFCLVNLKEEQKNQFAMQLNKIFPNDNVTVFMYDDVNGKGPWLKQAGTKSRFIVMNKTNLPIFVEEALTDTSNATDKIYEVTKDNDVESIFNKIKKTFFKE